jgi:TPR repeat protein
LPLEQSTSKAHERFQATLSLPAQRGVVFSQAVIAMKQRLLFSFFLFSMFLPCASAPSQSANSAQQSESKPVSQFPKWTAADEIAYLTKAQQGDANSQLWLACAYEQGWLGKTNYPEALKWFRRSAEQGNPDAQVELGRMYQDGEGVAQNYVLAAKWYRKAAQHVPTWGGAGQGRNDLGLLYLNGDGVPKDFVQAYMWFSLDSESNSNLPYAKTHMTPEQIHDADRMIAKWKSQHPDPPAK